MSLPAPRLSLCRACALREGCKAPVPPSGSPDAPILLIGESPGKSEDRYGVPFVGPSGKELDNYLKLAGLSRHACRVANVVNCRPPDDRDPLPGEIRTCQPWLVQEVEQSKAVIIGAVGSIAAHALLGPDFNLDMGHGIPISTTFNHLGLSCVQCTVVPMYHPAYGLHSTATMGRIREDFMALGRTMRGEIQPGGVVDQYPKPSYSEIHGDEVKRLAVGAPIEYTTDDGIGTVGIVMFVDTESRYNGSPLCVSFTSMQGHGYVVMADDVEGMGYLKDALERPDMLVVLHNAKYDLEVLSKMGIEPTDVADTMVAAYLLQKEPQGLKALGYRKCGMVMGNYHDMVSPYTTERAMGYLIQAMAFEWPDPEPEMVWDRGVPRVKNPQNIGTKIRRIISDVGKDPSTDPYDRWLNFDLASRQMVESVLGPLHPCDLTDIPRDEFVTYSARDADATCRIWPILWAEIERLGLEPTFWPDMGMTRMVLDMERVGMGIDVDKFAGLSAYYDMKMRGLSEKVSKVAGIPVNPGSTLQVGEMLYKLLKLPCVARTPKGAPSTDEETLKKLVSHHPVVKDIMEWRGYGKNKGTYADAIPLLARDGRVHADLKTTRVYTGRLSSANPNLMAIPVRSEEGIKIRQCFMARDGCSLVSGDYSQIEMRLAAHVSQDPEMLKIFRQGLDIHSQTASKIFGIPVDRLDPVKHRSPAKTVGFGVLYGISAEGLLDQLIVAGCEGWNLKSCDGLIKEWFRVFKRIKDYFDGKIAEARRNGYVTDLFGRVYHIPEMKSALPHIREAGERQACNYPIQGGAQGVMKRGMVKMIPIYRGFRESCSCDPLLQIHDDLLWEVSDELVPVFIPLFKDAMETAVELSIPLEIEAKTGKSWGNMEKWKG